ncbi:hypothetical protein CTKA_02839 [Chthonomonas calidirosea]|uniref:Uncharacterized protein n=1 Tax=Chthonomonas calidirosea (strain DSM 23976 / ICMP 18418 / T49) TaxID=1303518 RepID=S0EU18_CHTCT|nr:hypothetical protein [Chthonomonas calidirosea]CCW35078.1 hypothetical protein CCALI_01260 [Chthonomonas calidirosea T49]CEK20905.1 hypothetical protein CTKA_02839 [Chthonomonas calidirosea]
MMRDALHTVRDVRLVRPDDTDYIAYRRRMADLRPSRGGPRQAGEVLGGLVEQAVRHWIGKQVPLQEERILSWEQRLANGRHGRLYRELDAVWPIDHESLCIFEIKFTTKERMEMGVGLDQLDAAAEILARSKQVRYLLLRLVYVGAEPVPVLVDEENPEGLLEVPPTEEYEELGVVWVPPAAVEESALELGLELPANWLEPEAREGAVEDPERDAWRFYVESTQETTLSENPLAAALKRLLKEAQEDEARGHSV